MSGQFRVHKQKAAASRWMVVFTALLFVICVFEGCGHRSVGTPGADSSFDAGVLDGGRDRILLDGPVGPDTGNPCHAEALAMGFVVQTDVAPQQPEPDVIQYEITGELVYHGSITEPLATDPAFDREAQLADGQGRISIVQYHLPLEQKLPVEQNSDYIFTYRERNGFAGYATGLVIKRPTSGLTPLLFVGDNGVFGRAFTPEDPLMHPLKVYREQRPECPVEPLIQCPDSAHYWDRLRFDSSTGGQQTEIEINQTEYGRLPVFGDDFWVLNLVSVHHAPLCGPDDVGEKTGYLAASISALPACDPQRLYFWDDPAGIEVGTFCDSLTFCLENEAQKQGALAVAPDLLCTDAMENCGFNGNAPGCGWEVAWEGIDDALYKQICAVSVLPDPPSAITCRVYFD